METPSLININKLSPREKEVAIHIVDGLSTKNIAQALGIKSNTVSTMKNRIFVKLGADSVVGLYKIVKG
jgi:two-component system invasion response regulator UvrY